jgi:hypothetical protein
VLVKDIATEVEAIGMYGHDAGDWLWMALGMGLWLIVTGAVVYTAVRLAYRDHGGGRGR